MPGVPGRPASFPVICLLPVLLGGSAKRNPEYLGGLLGSEEGVGNHGEDAQRHQTCRTIRTVILKVWSLDLCFRFILGAC